jgi:hypothetical protein
MYTWIWRHLPGVFALKLLQTFILLAGVCAVLLFVVFPAIEPHLPINHVTVPNNAQGQ